MIFYKECISMQDENVRALISEIKDGLKQRSASSKDETRVMKAMLNDPNYKVTAYDKKGNTTEYCPSADMRKVAANIIATTTKMPMAEASELANNYEFTKADSTSLVNVSKEFVNTYIQTGRKMNLGGRDRMDVSIMLKHIQEKEKAVPSTESKAIARTTFVPAHDGIRVQSKCPSWLY